eukprot:1133005-Rhodomonas_salina.1
MSAAILCESQTKQNQMRGIRTSNACFVLRIAMMRFELHRFRFDSKCSGRGTHGIHDEQPLRENVNGEHLSQTETQFRFKPSPIQVGNEQRFADESTQSQLATTHAGRQ